MKNLKLQVTKYIIERLIQWNGLSQWAEVQTVEVDTGKIIGSRFADKDEAEKELATYRRDRPENQYRLTSIN